MDRLDLRKYAGSLASWTPPWLVPSKARQKIPEDVSGSGGRGANSNSNSNSQCSDANTEPDQPKRTTSPGPSYLPRQHPIHQSQSIVSCGFDQKQTETSPACQPASPSSNAETSDLPHLDAGKLEAYHRAYYQEASRSTFYHEYYPWISSHDLTPSDFGPKYPVNRERHRSDHDDEDDEDDAGPVVHRHHWLETDEANEDSLAHSSDEDLADRMARNRAGPPKRVADLKGVLTQAEKDELAQLVLRIMDRMGREITNVFDSQPVTPVETENPTHGWIALPLQNREYVREGDSNQKGVLETAAAAAAADDQISSDASKAADASSTGKTAERSSSSSSSLSFSQAHQIIEKEEHEAMTPQLQELKKELSVAYKKWQTFVTNRIRDVKVTEQSQSGHGPTGAGRGGRWPGRGGSRGDRRGGRGRGAGGGGGGPSMVAGTMRPPPLSEVDPQLVDRFRPCPTTLWQLPLEKRKVILHTMLLLVLSLEEYNAYARLLMLHLTSSLHLGLKVLQEDEIRVAQSLGKTASDFNPDEIVQEKADENKNSRKIKVGLAGIAGAALVGVTGGLAAPLVAAGLGSVLGGLGLGATAAAGLLGTVAESGVVVGALFGMYGAKASVKSMESYARDIQDFAFIPLHGQVQSEIKETKDVHHQDRRLRVVFGISGWLTSEDDVVRPWKCLGSQAESYALRWELTALMNMGNALDTVIKSAAWGVAKKEIISHTIFASLMEGLWPLGLLKINKIIDNPWSMGMVRAEKAGAVLADAIQRRLQGGRPISLIGYSLAARAIYTCLMVLAERRQFGLIDSVVLIGTPAPSETRVWLTLKSVVSGRLVNVYSENDYILGFLYRMSNIQFGIAGLQEIHGVRGVENYNVSNLVSGHLRYQYMMGAILKNIGWEDLDLDQVRQEEQLLREMDQKDTRENHDQAQESSAGVDMDKEVARIEDELKQKNEGTQANYRPRGGGGRGRRGGRRNNSGRKQRGEPKTGRSTVRT